MNTVTRNYWLISAAATVIWPHHVGITFSHWFNLKLALWFHALLIMTILSLLVNDALLGPKFWIVHESLEVLLALFELASPLLALLLRPVLDKVLKHLFALLWVQEKITVIKDNLVKLLLPRWESRHLDTKETRLNLKMYRHWYFTWE